MLHRHLIFSFVYWYNRQVLLLLMLIGTVLLFVLVCIPGTVLVCFLFGDMYIRARFTAVYAYMCNYSGMYVELVYMYDHHNWARLPILLAVS